ncbi:MAG: hypothetical protein DA407_15245 [Bacteroidetes bacterium]|nr:MAG: hypothetical protein DA407_15245 [Bacteroidota bacterium]
MNSNAQQNNTPIEKDEFGISVNAPKGVHQYAFRVGEWEATHKALINRYEWEIGTGQHKVYVADNGLTFVEETLDDNGKLILKITYDYIEETDSWENNYLEIDTGKKIKYTSKLVDGNMVETIEREDNVNNNTYTVVGDNIYIYTARRTFGNGYTIVNYVGISTKQVRAN